MVEDQLMAQLKEELDTLRITLLTMASHAESAVRRALTALAERDTDLASGVRADDAIIDRLELEVDEQAIRLLSMAPLGADLRLIAVSMKISQNLERVGDEAAKIANRARDLALEPPLKLTLAVPQMAELALQMLKTALDAFADQNPAVARALIPQDKQVDAHNKEMHRLLTDQMIRDSETIPRCLHWMVIVRSLERIADHAKNVAEEVVYLCEADDIRHSGKVPTATSG